MMLRVKHKNCNYRILYFFCEKSAILFDGIIKTDKVPPREILRAMVAKAQFQLDPKMHTLMEKTYES